MLAVTKYPQAYVDQCRALIDARRLVADKQIKLKPETSVRGYAAGDQIAVDAADVRRLSAAFVEALQRKYVEA
jgi:hypothetical protein